MLNKEQIEKNKIKITTIETPENNFWMYMNEYLVIFGRNLSGQVYIEILNDYLIESGKPITKINQEYYFMDDKTIKKKYDYYLPDDFNDIDKNDFKY